MDPETPNTETPAAAPATLAVRTYTEAEVSAMQAAWAAKAQEEKNAAAAAARREAQKKAPAETPPKPNAAPDPAPAPVGLSEVDVLRISKFQRALGAAGLSPGQEAIVEKLFSVERPDVASIGEWVAAQAKEMGVGAKPSAPVTPAAPNAPAAPAPIATSAPATAVPLERDVDILSMDAASVHELMRRKGASDPSRPYDPRNRAGRREIRKAFEESMAKKRVRLGSL